MAFFSTLKFQIGLALFFLVFAMAGSMLATQYIFEQTYQAEKIIQLGGKLQKSSQQMSMQAMNYLANTPTDSSTYERDLKLYYKDLVAHIDTFDMIDNAFMSSRFSQDMTGMDDMMETVLSPEVETAVKDLHKTWIQWREVLLEKLGSEPSMPRLNLAAQYIEQNGQDLSQASDRLLLKLSDHAYSRKQQLQQLNQYVLVFTVLIALVIIIWFYRRVIRSLIQTGKGMELIALGDFKHRLPVSGNDEISRMNHQFNYLNQQLQMLFQLMTRLYDGSNLDESLRFISEEFSTILPIDWIGVLFVTGDSKIQLERGYYEGHPENFGSIRFDLEGTLLKQSMDTRSPLHIEDIETKLAENQRYKFLNILVSKSCREAIFLPLVHSETLQGVLVFASKQSHGYTPEHLELLKNLSMLITLSFSQTVKLADYQHLAAIGRFATGIAHEIRSPLATINMAIDYFKDSSDISESVRKRALLASDEAERVKHLMEEILLYAKPLRLDSQRHDLKELINYALALVKTGFEEKSLHFEMLASDNTIFVMVDREKLIQVILNLLQNAIQASEQGGTIVVILSREPESGWILLEINNRGERIAPDLLQKVFEPFYTTRAHGTGLGLNIVKRIIEAHGGEISASSDAKTGTTLKLSLPSAS